MTSHFVLVKNETHPGNDHLYSPFKRALLSRCCSELSRFSGLSKSVPWEGTTPRSFTIPKMTAFFEARDTLPETNSSPLKIDPWNLGDSYWKLPIFRGENVSFREGIHLPNLLSFLVCCQISRVLAVLFFP